jgi:transposase-like protein
MTSPGEEAQDFYRHPKTDSEGVPLPYRPEGKIHTRYPKELKFHVTLEALRERVPQCELGAMYGVPQSLISIWKKAAIETIRGNIHYKQRKRRAALNLMDDLQDDEPLPPVTSDAVQHLCTILRGAVRQLERDPAALEKLMKSELED